MTSYIPLATTFFAIAFSILLLRQYLQRRKVHQLVWTTAMILYGITALMEYLANPEIVGPDVSMFRIYYILAAPLVALLGAGTVYLLASRRIADIFLTIMLILSIALILTGLVAPLDPKALAEGFQEGLPQGFRTGSRLYPLYVRSFAIVLNSVGGAALIGGALYSFIRDRTRTYNLFLAAGGILPATGGSLLGFFGNPDIFFEFELAGTIFLFIGFILSSRYIARREAERHRLSRDKE